jgi:hypothetical protein
MRLPDLPRVEVFFARSGHLLVALGMSLFFASGAPAQTTKKNPLPVAPNVANPYTCSIAEFRTMALTTHDPQERGDLAAQWLKANGPACSISQVLLLSSNRPQWLGSANTVRIAGVFDQIIENKLKNDPLALKYLYGSEGAPSAGGGKKGAEETSAGGAPAAPAAGAAPPPGTVTLAVGNGSTAAPIGGAPAPAAQNLNISLGASSPQPEDLSRKLPLDSEAKPVFPPERGKQMKNYFGKLRTEMIRNYFMENSSPGSCPEGLSFSKAAGCETKNPVAWKFGEALPSSAKTFPIPEPLLGKLSFYPGYQFMRVGTDVLAIEKDSGKVADAVLNLGKTN